MNYMTCFSRAAFQSVCACVCVCVCVAHHPATHQYFSAAEITGYVTAHHTESLQASCSTQGYDGETI